MIAIKIAPFNRYATQEVFRGVIDSGRSDEITLYTGNDDHIVLDLLSPFTWLKKTVYVCGACWATGPCGPSVRPQCIEN